MINKEKLLSSLNELLVSYRQRVNARTDFFNMIPDKYVNDALFDFIYDVEDGVFETPEEVLESMISQSLIKKEDLTDVRVKR